MLAGTRPYTRTGQVQAPSKLLSIFARVSCGWHHGRSIRGVTPLNHLDEATFTFGRRGGRSLASADLSVGAAGTGPEASFVVPAERAWALQLAETLNSEATYADRWPCSGLCKLLCFFERVHTLVKSKSEKAI